MRLGIYLDYDKAYVTECEYKRNKVTVKNKYSLEHEGIPDKSLADRILKRNKIANYKDLNITLPTYMFKIDYYKIDKNDSGLKREVVDSKISSAFPKDQYITKTFELSNNKDIYIIAVALRRKEVDHYIRFARDMRLRPKILSPYFVRLSKANIPNDNIAVIYSDGIGADIIFFDKKKVLFFRRLEKMDYQEIREIINYYELNISENELEKLYIYGRNIIKTEGDSIYKDFEFPEGIEEAGYFNALLAAKR